MNVLWKYRLGHDDMPQLDHLLTNATGNLLIGAGNSGEAIVFGFDSTGRFLWRTPIDTYRAWLGGAALDADGSAYATAWFDTDVRVAGHSISGGMSSSVYLLKLDKEGKRLWSKALAGEGVEDPRLFLGPHGELLFGGGFISDLRIGAVRLPGRPARPGALSHNLFLSQLDASGSLQWVREFLGEAFFTRIAQDGTAAGDILVSGDFWESLAFDPASPMVADKHSGDSRDHFVAKLDATGHLRWARHLEAQSLVPIPDGSGEAYICALSGTEIKKVSADGRVLYKVALPKDGPECASLAADDKGTFYVAGRKDGPRDPKTGDPVSMQHVLKMDSTGKIIGSLSLLPDFSNTPGPQLLWSRGRLFVAGGTGKYRDPAFYLAELTL